MHDCELPSVENSTAIVKPCSSIPNFSGVVQRMSELFSAVMLFSSRESPESSYTLRPSTLAKPACQSATWGLV